MSAEDLKDNTPGAVAQRRAYWAQRAREESRPKPAARSSSRSGPHPIVSVARGAGGHVKSFASNPGRYAKSGKAENKVGLAVMLFFAVMFISIVRKGRWPDASGFAAIAVGTIAVVAMSAIAPDLVVTTLVVAFLILAILNVDVITQITGSVLGPLTKVVQS